MLFHLVGEVKQHCLLLNSGATQVIKRHVLSEERRGHNGGALSLTYLNSDTYTIGGSSVLNNSRCTESRRHEWRRRSRRIQKITDSAHILHTWLVCGVDHEFGMNLCRLRCA